MIAAKLLLVVTLVWPITGYAGQPLAFPGAAQFPVADLGDDDEVIHVLYEGRLLVPGPAYPVCQPDCGLTVKGKLTWKDARGQAHAGYVIVAEPDESTASHADGGLIGMVDLVHTPRGWEIAAGSPVAAEEGSFGKAPEVHVINGGVFGMAVITKPGFINQGVVTQNWNLYVERGTAFKQALSLPMMVDNSARCDEPNCTKLDFTSKADVDSGPAGLTVRMTKIMHDGHTASKDYQIKP